MPFVILCVISYLAMISRRALLEATVLASTFSPPTEAWRRFLEAEFCSYFTAKYFRQQNPMQWLCCGETKRVVYLGIQSCQGF